MDEEEKIDERILELTDIFNELTTNAIGLSKDLVSGITAIRHVSIFWFISAIIMLLFGETYGWNMNTIVLPILFVLMGIFNLWRFRTLKKKYSQIYEIRKELEMMKV